MDYAVMLGTTAVGKVQVIREGLYYRFYCRCRMEGNTVCRLYVCTGDRRESLGVLVPMGDGFGLDTRVPIKRLGDCLKDFQVLPKRDPPAHGNYTHSYPEVPYAYLERQKRSFLERPERK